VAYWFFIPAVVAVLAGGGIFTFGPNLRRFHKYMGFTLVFEGLFLLLTGVLREGSGQFNSVIYLLYVLLMLLSPFFYYLASLFLLKEDGVRKKDFWMLEAVAAFAIIYLFLIPAIPVGSRNEFQWIISGRMSLGNDIGLGTSVMLSLDNAAFLFFLIEQLFVQIFCFVSLKRYNKLLECYFSNLKGKSSEKILIIFSLVAVRFVLFVGICFFPSISGDNWFHLLQTAIFALFYSVTAFFVCRVEFTAEELGVNIARQEAESKAAVPLAYEVIASRLESLVAERFFLDPDIDLLGLSSKVQVNSKYVADYIRFQYKETFLNFVNRLRVDYSVNLMQDSSLSLLDIAESSGYTNPSTYYRNFAKIKGVSPSEYRKKL